MEEAMAGAKPIRTIKQDIERQFEDPEFTRLYGAADAKAEVALLLGRIPLTIDLMALGMAISQRRLKGLMGGDVDISVGELGTLLAQIGLRLVLSTAPLPGKELPSGTGGVQDMMEVYGRQG